MLENRNKDLTNLHKGADYLGRSLRENLRVFSVDSADKRVQLLSENGTVISCNYNINDSKLIFEHFEFEASEEFVSHEKVETEIENSIDSFIDSLRGDRYDKADSSFDDLVNLFETKTKVSAAQAKLEKASEVFGAKTVILDSKEFYKMEEIKPLIINFIRENQEIVLENIDLKNSVKISNALHSAFALKHTDYDALKTSKPFSVDLNSSQSLYEMVCQQELLRQELIEAKESFSDIWISNDKVQNLASLIYAKENVILESLESVIEEVPYFAFASKADLNSILTSIYEVNSTDIISKKDVKEFTRTLFEAKKPAKTALVGILNEKYGINLTNLKFVPTFSNLAKTQSVFFEVISLLSKDEGVLPDVTKDFARFVAKKGGVETLAVNDYIQECLAEAGIDNLNENLLLNYINMPKLTQDLAALKTLLGGGGEGGEMGVGGAIEGAEEREGFEPEGTEMDYDGEPSPLEAEGEEDVPDDEEKYAVTPQDSEGGPGEADEAPVDEEEPEGIEGESEEGTGAQEDFEVGNGEEGEEGEEGGEEEVHVGDDSVEGGGTGTDEKHESAAQLVADLEALVKGMGVQPDEDREDREQYGA